MFYIEKYALVIKLEKFFNKYQSKYLTKFYKLTLKGISAFFG